MNQLLTTVECVLFDLDGTLVQTDIDFPLMKRRMISLAAEWGFDSSKLADMDILAIVDGAGEFLTVTGKPDQAVQLRHRAMAVLEEIELERARDTREVPFARELVAELKNRQIGVGVVTRNCRKASLISLGITRIIPDVLVSREDTVRHKPHPEPLRMALSKLGAAHSDSVMVGDHIMDVQSGKAAGMKTIGLLDKSRPKEFFEQVNPDFVAGDLSEVLDAIVRRDR